MLEPKIRVPGISWSGMGLPMGLIISFRSWSVLGEKLCLFVVSCVFDLLVAFRKSACVFPMILLVFQLCL